MTQDDLGFRVDPRPAAQRAGVQWRRDPVTDVVAVGRADLERREFAKTTLYSLAALAVPMHEWHEIAERGTYARGSGAAVGSGEVSAVRHMTAAFYHTDERFGGGHGRLPIVAYLVNDVAGYLRGRYANADDRRAMFSAAAELTYLAGWKAFDSALHGLAQNYYLRALRLANEADDQLLAAFILRAMANQAMDLGHAQTCVRLAEAALDRSGRRATPGASALFTVVKARGLAAERQATETTSNLLRAENLLSRVDRGAEPIWINRIVGEPSLANHTGQALRDLGDLGGAERQFKRSIATRDGMAFPRVQALTLANLANVQFTRSSLPEACKHWSGALDIVAGMRSSRADDAVANIRRRLATLGPRMPTFARELDERAASITAPA